jgi:hypothetical protein
LLGADGQTLTLKFQVPTVGVIVFLIINLLVKLSAKANTFRASQPHFEDNTKFINGQEIE